MISVAISDTDGLFLKFSSFISVFEFLGQIPDSHIYILIENM